MSAPNPATVELRRTVRSWLTNLPAYSKILVGVSGGADSMALALVLKLEGENFDLEVVPVIVDHGLQKNSDLIAQETADKLKKFGFKEVFLARAQVTVTDGLESSARRARYKIFEQAIDTFGAINFFLAHTENDQAENVLLGLARGSGTKSLSGMAQVNGLFIRPFLTISRALTVAVCNENGIDYWQDPHNQNEEFMRVRVRKNILPLMQAQIGPGIISALARSARILREDSDALDSLAEKYLLDKDLKDLEIAPLLKLPKAIRTRVLRSAIYVAGAPAGSISAEHLAPIEALVTDWHGQGPTSLPGGVKVSRISGRLSLSYQTPGQKS
jgi:tRNA(Ile)-lysidine synthase